MSKLMLILALRAPKFTQYVSQSSTLESELFLHTSEQLENASTFHFIYVKKVGKPVTEKQERPRMLHCHALSDESDIGTPRQQ